MPFDFQSEYNLVPAIFIPQSILSLIPPTLAQTYCVLPYRINELNQLEVFMAEPFSAEALQALQLCIGSPVKPVAIAGEELRTLVIKYYGSGRSSVRLRG